MRVRAGVRGASSSNRHAIRPVALEPVPRLYGSTLITVGFLLVVLSKSSAELPITSTMTMTMYFFNSNYNKCLAKKAPAEVVDDPNRSSAETQRRTWPEPETIQTKGETAQRGATN
eukprot:COSAG02_NODE_3638_length_6442_cov_6.391297_4_plen_116_part_00